MTGSLEAEGEIRHEQCRYGIFSSEAYRVDARGKETPFAMPMCGWRIEGPRPPLLERLWSGAIDFSRDCAVCQCFEAVAPNPTPSHAQTPQPPTAKQEGQ